MTTTGADVDDLLGVWRELGSRADHVEEAGRSAAAAVARFVARSSEVVPALGNDGSAGIARDVRDLQRAVDDVGRALAAADAWVVPAWMPGGGAPATDRWGRPRPAAVGVREVLELRQLHTAVRGSQHVARLGVARGDRIVRGTTRSAVAAARADAAAAGWLAPQQWRAVGARSASDVRTLLHGVDPAADAAQGAAALAGGGLAAGRLARARGVAARAQQVLSSGRVGAVGRLGGHAFNVVGIASDAGGAFVAVQEGRHGDAAAHAAAGVGQALLYSGAPPVQVVGVLLVAGATAYQHRATLARWGRGGRRAAGRLVDGARGFVEGLF